MTDLVSPRLPKRREPKPPWLKVRAPAGPRYLELKKTLRGLDLYTVCEEARCPNVGECWAAGTATVMLLGHTCTRGCRFCAVTTGNPRGAVDPREPQHVARAIAKLGLRYVVLTMVDRDDLLDGGADHVAETVLALRSHEPTVLVEVLVSDFAGQRAHVARVLESQPHVFAHNVEVTRRLTPTIRDPRCSYDRSLSVLDMAKDLAPRGLTKSSIMVGVGETQEEVFATLRDLRSARVDVATLGQYLRPTEKHAPVARYVSPDEFAEYERYGLELGFQYVASGPLVRSSYHAAEAFVAARVASGEPDAGGFHLGDVREAPGPGPAEPSAGPQLLPASALLRRSAPRS
jgi:lipoic acid synthetase